MKQKQVSRKDLIRVAMTSGAPKLSAPTVTTARTRGQMPKRFG